jgi:hypothetical protein
MVPLFLTFTLKQFDAEIMFVKLKNSFFLMTLLIFPLFIYACGMNNPDVSENKLQEKVYRNPVVQESLPDPTIIKASDGWFYLYATEDIRNTPIYKSDDLVNWEFAGTAFTNESRPDFEPKGGLWAPDINYITGNMCCTIRCRYGVANGPVVLVWPRPTPPGVLLPTMENYSAAMKLRYKTPLIHSISKRKGNITCFGEVSGGFMSSNLPVTAWL